MPATTTREEDTTIRMQHHYSAAAYNTQTACSCQLPGRLQALQRLSFTPRRAAFVHGCLSVTGQQHLSSTINEAAHSRQVQG
jgi:hypothetical protein